ncbi:MAG: Clp protease N-terminal domain-containing protein, partial [Candidatus Dormibacteria bacterium]
APGGARGGRQWLRGFRASSRFLNSQPQAMLSAPATSALALAEEEAARAGGRCGTEHLLLGLLRQGEGKAALVLAALGVELGSCRQAVAGLPLTGEPVTPLVYEPELESALGTSWQLAAEVAGGVVDTDSLLLTICKLPDCRACQVLARLGVDRDQVAARLGPAGEGPPGS